MTKKEYATQITALLSENYPDARCALTYTKDYELLFATRLSAQCTDVRVNLITPSLFRRFPDLESFAAANVTDIEEEIKSCGFFHTKARDLKGAAQMLLEKHNGIVPNTMEALLELPGIGRKTANLILGDIYGQPGIIADTHCIRLSGRLGLVPAGTKDPLKVEKELLAILEPSESVNFCHRLVWHGREVCSARSPKCQACCLATCCPSFPLV